MARSLPRFTVPVGHILMGAAGWVLYIFAPCTVVMVLAVLLTLLAVPRFVRGSIQEAEARMTVELEAEVAPSLRLMRVLAPGERPLWEMRRHPICMIVWHMSALLLTGTVAVIGVYASWLAAGIIWSIGLVIYTCRVALWYRDRLSLTNHRIIEVSGIIKHQTDMMPAKKLTDARLQIPWHSNVLAWLRLIRLPYGTVIVESAGQDQALKRIAFVPYANLAYRMIAEAAL